MQASKNLKNKMLFIVICLMWSFTWIAGKYQIESGISPEVGVLYRFCSIGIISLFFSILLKHSMKASKKELRIIFFYTCGCASFYMILLYYVAGFMITSISAIVFSFSIIITGFFKHIFKISTERIGVITTSFLIGLVGLFFIMMQKFHHAEGKNLKIGISLALLATFIYSLGSLYYEKNKGNLTIKSFPLFFYVSIFSILICLSVACVRFTIGKVITFTPIFSFAFLFSYIYLVFSGFGIMLMMILIKKVGSVKASYVNITTPIFAVLASSIFENYQIMQSTIIGIALVIVSNFVILKYGKLTKNNTYTKLT